MTLLVWRSGEHFDHFRDLPCVLCRRPTPIRSHADEPVHKACAELWTSRHPDSRRYYSDDAPAKRRTASKRAPDGTEAAEPWAEETLFDQA